MVPAMRIRAIKLLIYLALAVTLVWIFWYGLYSTVIFYHLQAFKASHPVLTLPILEAGVWHLPNRDFENSSSIPRILHQAFKSEMVYENYLPMINSCLTVNPDWEYYLWRDSDAEDLIASFYPAFLPRYKSYSDNLERADSIRYIVLHHFGGIYLDMDVECKQPFFPALSRLPAFVDQERTEQSNIFWSMPFSAMNSAMGSVPEHPFFQVMIDAMLKFGRIGNAFDSTGPRLLTQKYAEYSNQLKVPPVAIMDPRVFSPLMDSEKNWRQLCKRYMHGTFVSTAGRGCRTLASKNWSFDDSDNATLAVHRFLHLGYNFKASSRRRSVNLRLLFPDRINFYSRNASAFTTF